MITLDVNDSVILEQQQALEAALSTNPKTQKALQKLIRKTIMQARAEVVNSIKFKNGDPRQSRQAVRTAVYKKILGANINIYNSRRSHGGTNTYEPPRHPSRRGGNRMLRSERTQAIMNYPPQDRGFILRWINSGTNPRYAAGRNGRWDRSGNNKTFFDLQEQGDNYRGSIAPRNFFKGAAERALLRARDNLATLIDAELADILNKKKK